MSIETKGTLPNIGSVKDIAKRVKAINWEHVSQDLNAYGGAMIKRLITLPECEALARLYPKDEIFCSRVIMAQHSFGRGEYKYFSYPLPDIIEGLRTTIYPFLAPTANHWNTIMGIDVRYPEKHAEYIARCHNSGQLRPTPLLLQYGVGDHNCLHQDLYGKHVFSLQVTILLSV